MVKIVSIRPWNKPFGWPDRFYLEIVDERGGKYLWGEITERGSGETYWNRWSPRSHRAIYGWGQGMEYDSPEFFREPPPEIVEYLRCLQLGIAWRHVKAIRKASAAQAGRGQSDYYPIR